MPFITNENREKVHKWRYERECKRQLSKESVEFITSATPGDWCYIFYLKMMERWNVEPRWTTAHDIYRDMRRELMYNEHYSIDQRAACELAWQVFFHNHVIDYEYKKISENGDIIGDEYIKFKTEIEKQKETL